MKVLVYTDKGGAGKTTVATEVLPFYFQNFTLLDTDPNNFTSLMEFPNGEVKSIDPRVVKQDLKARKEFASILRNPENENLIIDTAGGYLANLVINLLEKEGYLKEIDIAIIPIKVGGKSEENALKSYLNLKNKGYKNRIVFALVGVNQSQLNWDKVRQLYPTWFGLDFLVEDELVELESFLGKLNLSYESLEKEVDVNDRNYLIIPNFGFLFVKGAITNKPAYAFLEKRQEIFQKMNQKEKEMYDLIKSIKELKPEERENRKEELKRDAKEVLEAFIPHFIIDAYLRDIQNFYSMIEKQYDVLVDRERVELGNMEDYW